MKSISTLDLKLVDELSKYTIFELIHPDNDDIVAPVLYEYGMDTNKGVEVVCSHHRRLNREAATSFVFVGEVRCDAAFRLSPFCSVEDRLIAAGKHDQSLAKELAAMSKVSQSAYGLSYALDDEEAGELHQDKEDIERIESELEVLEQMLMHIRPEQHRKDGSLKKMREYNKQDVYEKVRKKKDNRSTLRHRESKREQI